MMDIAIPSNNENEFIEIAEKLGYNELYFLYNFNNYLEKKEKLQLNKTKLKLNIGILVDFNNVFKIKNKIKDKNFFTVIKNTDDNRKIIEKSCVSLIHSLETDNKLDFMHQRASGLNQIMCKFAKQNKVNIGFSFKSILQSKNKSQILGRISQNIRLCRKYKVKTTIASFAEKPFEMRAPRDLISLFITLGMTQTEAQNSLSNNVL